MKESAFIRQNSEQWKQFQELASDKHSDDPDRLADLFIRITDDLSYSRTFYPNSKTTKYLNTTAASLHQRIYRNRKESRGRLRRFWIEELPHEFAAARREILLSLSIFTIALLVGVVSSAYDDTFARLILGDSYVNMTLENIGKGDPMAVYKKMNGTDMFFGITFNNIRVSFIAFIGGILLSFGSIYALFKNGVMLGTFQYFFIERGLFWESAKVIWIHGTIEISAIVIAGASGLTLGNAILFPGNYTRLQSFRRGAYRGLKIATGLVPLFIIAGFLESFVTRHSDMPWPLSLLIIGGSAVGTIHYFIIYPFLLERRNNGNI
ncbi:stage II sporulation protein M [Ignavibacteria bacterium]|jgi:uncharacterized membrane protein SpoIIM required for sporulation|nr:stage II sporulation protein M [Bacteroidota bacterium]MCZ2132619.1 stage II sporulation protein M [Bacteroidota bacterium]